MRRRELLRAGGALALAGLGGCAARSGGALAVSSPAFEDGGELPVQFACDGVGDSPPFEIETVPEPTAALAVVGRSTVGVLNNPTLWTLWNVPRETERIPAALPRTPTVPALGDARQGARSGGEAGYRPPCPPREQAFDHWFQVYALETRLEVPGGTPNEQALEAIEPASLASTRITVSYTRQ